MPRCAFPARSYVRSQDGGGKKAWNVIEQDAVACTGWPAEVTPVTVTVTTIGIEVNIVTVVAPMEATQDVVPSGMHGYSLKFPVIQTHPEPSSSGCAWPTSTAASTFPKGTGLPTYVTESDACPPVIEQAASGAFAWAEAEAWTESWGETLAPAYADVPDPSASAEPGTNRSRQAETSAKAIPRMIRPKPTPPSRTFASTGRRPRRRPDVPGMVESVLPKASRTFP